MPSMPNALRSCNETCSSRVAYVDHGVEEHEVCQCQLLSDIRPSASDIPSFAINAFTIRCILLTPFCDYPSAIPTQPLITLRHLTFIFTLLRSAITGHAKCIEMNSKPAMTTTSRYATASNLDNKLISMVSLVLGFYWVLYIVHW